MQCRDMHVCASCAWEHENGLSDTKKNSPVRRTEQHPEWEGKKIAKHASNKSVYALCVHCECSSLNRTRHLALNRRRTRFQCRSDLLPLGHIKRAPHLMPLSEDIHFPFLSVFLKWITPFSVRASNCTKEITFCTERASVCCAAGLRERMGFNWEQHIKCTSFPSRVGCCGYCAKHGRILSGRVNRAIRCRFNGYTWLRYRWKWITFHIILVRAYI